MEKNKTTAELYLSTNGSVFDIQANDTTHLGIVRELYHVEWPRLREKEK